MTSSLPVDDEVVEKARARGVSVIISPYDSAHDRLGRPDGLDASSASSSAASAPSSRDARISDIRRKIATLAAPALMVLDEDGALAGVLSKSDILKPVQTRLVLVDHNEITQAVSGAEEVADHRDHRPPPPRAP